MAFVQACMANDSLDTRWRQHLVGGGYLHRGESTLRLVMPPTSPRHYSDAQLDDYQTIPNTPLPWSAPLRLTIRARFSHPSGVLAGTAGFGFWNYPFVLAQGRLLPRLPRATWFFYASPPSDMQLDVHTAGAGWKVATIDTLTPAAPLLLTMAPVVVPLMNIPPLFPVIWQPIQRVLRIRETPVPPTVAMTDWHIYTLEWGVTTTRFLVDGKPILEHAPSPRGQLCFVLWIDNQYLVVQPWGRLRWGLLETGEHQWVEVDWLSIA